MTSPQDVVDRPRPLQGETMRHRDLDVEVYPLLPLLGGMTTNPLEGVGPLQEVVVHPLCPLDAGTMVSSPNVEGPQRGTCPHRR